MDKKGFRKVVLQFTVYSDFEWKSNQTKVFISIKNFGTEIAFTFV